VNELEYDQIYQWIILPFLIFAARICDVSIGTLRVIFVAKGYRRIAPVLGFIEVFIWIIVIGQIMQNLNNIACYLAYAAGFATGNYVGIYLDHKLSLGSVILRIITNRDPVELIAELETQNYGLTLVNAEGRHGPVRMIFMVLERHELPTVVELIHKFNPHAFYTVEDIRYFKKGVFPRGSRWAKFPVLGHWRALRKGKKARHGLRQRPRQRCPSSWRTANLPSKTWVQPIAN